MLHKSADKSPTAALYVTPAGYTSQRPAGFPPIARARLMRAAHAIARQFRPRFDTHAEAMAYGLRAAWVQVKSNREIQSLRAQVATVHHTPAQIERSRQATRRCGSSLWGS